MSRSLSLVTILWIILSKVSALCGREGFRMTGSAAVKPIAIAWARAYGSQCGWQVLVDPPNNGGLISTKNNIIITQERGDVSSDLLCNSTHFNTTNIILSDRPVFKASDSSGIHTCTGHGDGTLRSFIEVQVAIDSISVIVNRLGIARECINILGGGLTQDQLRWIFSDSTIDKLQATGWSNASLSKGIGSLEERRWSRLHRLCSRSWIQTGISRANTSYYTFFQDTIMRNIPQGTPSFSSLSRPIYSFEKDAEIANFVRKSNTAIGYVGYPSFFTKQDRLSTVAIQNNEGNFIIQNEMSITSNMYNPLSKQLYMIVPNESLSITRYFLEFAYSNYGDKILQDSGYIQIPTNEQLIMLTSLGSIERPNCVSLGSIECCAGNNQLKMFVVDDTERYFNVWKIYFEAACPTTYIMLINTKSSLPPIFRTGKISPESNFLDIAAVGSHIHQNNKRDLYPVSKPTFTYKCTKNQALFQAYSPPRTLAEFTIAPNPERFIYVNRAPSARSRTRCFLKFALCTLGTKVVQCNGLSFNNFASTMRKMCQRNNGF